MIAAVRVYGSNAAPVVLPEARVRFTIGTAAGCDLVIPAELVSEATTTHAIVERVDGGIVVRDHGMQFVPRADGSHSSITTTAIYLHSDSAHASADPRERLCFAPPAGNVLAVPIGNCSEMAPGGARDLRSFSRGG